MRWSAGCWGCGDLGHGFLPRSSAGGWHGSSGTPRPTRRALATAYRQQKCQAVIKLKFFLAPFTNREFFCSQWCEYSKSAIYSPISTISPYHLTVSYVSRNRRKSPETPEIAQNRLILALGRPPQIAKKTISVQLDSALTASKLPTHSFSLYICRSLASQEAQIAAQIARKWSASPPLSQFHSFALPGRADSQPGCHTDRCPALRDFPSPPRPPPAPSIQPPPARSPPAGPARRSR